MVIIYLNIQGMCFQISTFLNEHIYTHSISQLKWIHLQMYEHPKYLIIIADFFCIHSNQKIFFIIVYLYVLWKDLLNCCAHDDLASLIC